MGCLSNRTEIKNDLDDVWKWLGYSQKIRTKKLLNTLYFHVLLRYILTFYQLLQIIHKKETRTHPPYIMRKHYIRD